RGDQGAAERWARVADLDLLDTGVLGPSATGVEAADHAAWKATRTTVQVAQRLLAEGGVPGTMDDNIWDARAAAQAAWQAAARGDEKQAVVLAKAADVDAERAWLFDKVAFAATEAAAKSAQAAVRQAQRVAAGAPHL
ncbi:MAG TPA: hypothetical protein VMU82_11050, partial [Acetobacteraceae bacterium]|nr:hypothetical protein [Acetobacteraceae bacterium]